MICLQAYASVQLNADLGYSDRVYGFAAGVFFASYAIFQVSTTPLLSCTLVCNLAPLTTRTALQAAPHEL